MVYPQVDRAVLQSRIQGFGNINPPPLEEDSGAGVAKRVVGRLGDVIGEELMLTVEDFREKGAVGAVKDAVADAGDILIDGVSGIIGWVRGDPPPEDDETAEDATRALSNGPAGAAYGISQASPTGGINAVWVMPEDADPAALAQLAAQGGGFAAQQLDPRVPKNIQPYQPSSRPAFSAPPTSFTSFAAGDSGPVIAPYQPAPSGPGYWPRSAPSVAAPWSPAGYNSGGTASSPSRAFVERVAKGEVLPGSDVAKRLVSQCNASGTSAKALGEMVCERCRRYYLGLDGTPEDADAALARLLELTDALDQLGSDFATEAVRAIEAGALEELLSIRSSAAHKESVEPILRRLGFLPGSKKSAAPVAASVSRDLAADLLSGDSSGGMTSPAVTSAVEADLLSCDAAASAEADLLGVQPFQPQSVDDRSLDPLFEVGDSFGRGSAPPCDGGLDGLDLSSSAWPSPSPVAASAAVASSVPLARGSGSIGDDVADASAGKVETSEDAFGFVGGEMSKASKKP